MSDLDLINWQEVASAVIAAEDERRAVNRGIRYELPADAAKRTALETIDLTRDMTLLRANGFQGVGAYWCRIEDDKIVAYTRESAVKRLAREKENA